MPAPKICPSILSADFAHLGGAVDKMLELGAEWIHVDVMDGHFVPNLTIGAPVVASLRKNSPSAFLDVHLMVAKPEQWVDDFAKAGASQYTFHYEATDDAAALVAAIKKTGMRAGVALKPGTPLDDAVLALVPSIDLLLIMTVEPGFGGQSFMPDMMDKVKAARAKFPDLDIQVDGGLSPSTIGAAADAGANVIVAGSAIFKSDEPKAVIDTLRKAVVDAQG